MNGGKFGFIQFSATGYTSVKKRTVHFLATTFCSVGVAKQRCRAVLFDTKLNGVILVITGKPRQAEFVTRLCNAAYLYFAKPRRPLYVSNVSATVTLNKSIRKKSEFDETQRVQVTLSRVMKYKSAFMANFNQRFVLNLLVERREFYTEIVSAFISVIHTTTETTLIDVTIPPNGELRIDSQHFNVTLEGENIIHLHSGDWITIDSRLLELLVDTGSGGNLQGQILLNERYL